MRDAHLVVGCGEVGAALRSVLDCSAMDLRLGIVVNPNNGFDFLHICFPYSDRFHGSVQRYQDQFRPLYTIIHSTVPVGTADALGAHASPVRGRHPNLVESLKTFVKYVGGPKAVPICDELQTFGMWPSPHPNARDIEAGKLIDLMQFGSSVMLEKEIYAFCQNNSVDFNVVYRDFNQTYNDGFAAMGEMQFIRPILQHQEGPIGGHCIVENMKYLDSETAKRLVSR
jgi:hypothetical protein